MHAHQILWGQKAAPAIIVQNAGSGKCGNQTSQTNTSTVSRLANVSHHVNQVLQMAKAKQHLSKEVWKLNFRQYGEMERAQPGRNSDVEKVRREKIRDGESQKGEDAGARKGREVAKPCVLPVFCGSGGSKGRLAKAAGAEVAGQMRDEKVHAFVARSSEHFWKLRWG